MANPSRETTQAKKAIMSYLSQITARLEALARSPEVNSRYYQTGTGQYAEHDQFIGVRNVDLRIIANSISQFLILDFQRSRRTALYARYPEILQHRWIPRTSRGT